MVSSSVQNFPNPFSEMTHIQFNLSESSDVTLDIYNSSGQKIRTLVDTRLPAGDHVFTWRPGDLPSGIYMYTIITEGSSISKHMLLRK